VKGDNIKIKKKGWKTPREIGLCFKAKVVPQGNSATVSPSIPVELVGEDCYIIFPNVELDKNMICDEPEEG
jgi:putative transposon-encoded protein